MEQSLGRVRRVSMKKELDLQRHTESKRGKIGNCTDFAAEMRDWLLTAD